MLISHLKRFIFFKPVKTAGTSVEASLSKYCGPIDEVTERTDSAATPMGLITARFGGFHNGIWLYEHIHPLHARRKIPIDTWTKYYKFCTVRNPFDRFLSLYFWTIQPEPFQRPWKYGLSSQESQRHKLQFDQSRLDDYRLDFERKLMKMMMKPKGKADWSWIWLRERLLDDYFVSDQFLLDDFVRYESLESDLNRICSHLKIDTPVLPQFKSGVRPSWATPQNMYTDKSRRIIEQVCHNEIKHFCYSFPKSQIKL